jgi:purine-binding chemotaxis protein CheW
MNETMQSAEKTGKDMAARAGKYLTFRLASEEYGIEILKVQEIMGMMPVTHVPRTPEFVRGVINLRGKVIPVVDLRLKFAMEGKENTERTCIIVVQVDGGSGAVTTGFIVDEVSEVMDIAARDIEETPSFGADLDTNYILGMAKTKGSVKILVDIEKVLAAEEIVQLQQTD